MLEIIGKIVTKKEYRFQEISQISYFPHDFFHTKIVSLQKDAILTFYYAGISLYFYHYIMTKSHPC
jgi:hypothetical protein